MEEVAQLSLHKLTLVSKEFVQALQINSLIFGGIFKLPIPITIQPGAATSIKNRVSLKLLEPITSLKPVNHKLIPYIYQNFSNS